MVEARDMSSLCEERLTLGSRFTQQLRVSFSLSAQFQTGCFPQRVQPIIQSFLLRKGTPPPNQGLGGGDV